MKIFVPYGLHLIVKIENFAKKLIVILVFITSDLIIMAFLATFDPIIVF